MTNIGLIYNEKLEYPDFPFNPDKNYREIKYNYKPQPNNKIYGELRNLFFKLGYDKENYNSKEWNPLGFLIKRGDKVLIKPNFVQDFDKCPYCVITHPSIIRILIDYAFIATGNSGEIIVGDAPQMNCNLENMMNYTKIDKLIKYLNEKKIPVKFLDFRTEIVKDRSKIWNKRKIVKNFQLKNKIIDLKENSLLFDLEIMKQGNFYGADYDRKVVNLHHNIQRNRYCVTKALLDADVVINVPKLKTHKKAGITLNLKNIIGINVNKNFLPHYRLGCSNQGGDSFPNMNSFLNYSRNLRYVFRDLFLTKYYSKVARFFFRVLELRRYLEYAIVKIFFPQFYYHYFYMIDGNWHGNDTIWRTIIDLNIILMYSNKYGTLKDTIQRKVFSVVDGIIGGEKDGPLDPKPKKAGIILIGTDLFSIDLVCTKLMGFDYKKIPLLINALSLMKYPLVFTKNFNNIKIVSTNENLNQISYPNLDYIFRFTSATGWKLIEIS